MKKYFLIAISLFLILLVSCNNTPATVTEGENWLDAPSLKETVVDGGYFDRFGLACEYDEISNSEIAISCKFNNTW